MSFRRTLIGTIAVLAMLVTALAVLDRAQGPKLASAQVDTAAVATDPAQSLRLFLNERVETVRKSQVTITPATTITLASSPQLVDIQFTEPLDYATTYRVTVRGVTSSDDAQSSNLSYSFRTISPTLYYLRRGAGTDRIIRTSIRGTAQTVAYSAPRIQDFAVLPDALAVVTLDALGNSSLVLVASNRTVTRVSVPGPGTIGLIRGDQDTGVLGFTFTDAGATTRRAYSSTLFTVDPGGTARAKPVLGLGGKPLPVLQWFFVPNTAEVIAQAGDGSLLLLDPSNPKATTPLGSYLGLDSVAADGRSVVVMDANGRVAVALPAGRSRRLGASPIGGVHASGGAAQVIPGGWLQLDSTYDPGTGGFNDLLAFDNGSRARKLFTTANPRGSIDTFTGSPNSQYVAIETTPNVSTSKPDGYLVNGRPTSVTTELVDVQTGALVKSFAGFDLQW